MERPEWVPASAWPRLEAALDRQPAHALDAVSDLQSAAWGWEDGPRAALIGRFVAHAERGVPLPAAFIGAIVDLLEDHGE